MTVAQPDVSPGGRLWGGQHRAARRRGQVCRAPRTVSSGWLLRPWLFYPCPVALRWLNLTSGGTAHHWSGRSRRRRRPLLDHPRQPQQECRDPGGTLHPARSRREQRLLPLCSTNRHRAPVSSTTARSTRASPRCPRTPGTIRIPLPSPWTRPRPGPRPGTPCPPAVPQQRPSLSQKPGKPGLVCRRSSANEGIGAPFLGIASPTGTTPAAPARGTHMPCRWGRGTRSRCTPHRPCPAAG